MATSIIYLQGKALWAKVFERNRDRESPNDMVNQKLKASDGQTSLTLVMDQEELAKFEASGSRKKVNNLEDGPAVNFTRPWKHRIENFGGAPQIVDADGADWDDSVAIGNGSEVEVAISIYDTQAGKGTRLEGVKVLELVPYEEGDSGAPKAPKLPF
jgi:hypothetical protein